MKQMLLLLCIFVITSQAEAGSKRPHGSTIRGVVTYVTVDRNKAREDGSSAEGYTKVYPAEFGVRTTKAGIITIHTLSWGEDFVAEAGDSVVCLVNKQRYLLNLAFVGRDGRDKRYSTDK